ncbi:MAG: G-D-S-L family lipolytic protein [Phycisphaeraceae bacterium]|nr:G-D-S-L family lipolytic protein [Phycisphaeraceae bacterium]|tara:strand:- start:1348 stop:2004 length:657 start_codon:yes stop_codon:yes gene_type:complete
MYGSDSNPRDYRIYEQGYESVDDDPGLPRVLLVGDSISKGYTYPTRVALSGWANVHQCHDNARSTRQGLTGLTQWLGDEPWDVIHFNFGLHDISRSFKVDGVNRDHDHCAVSPQEYESNLRELVSRLAQTMAKLIWATSTCVPVHSSAKGRQKIDVIQYNEIAKRVMLKNCIVVNDLYELSDQKLRTHQRNHPADAHFDDDGYYILGAQVAQCIHGQL